MTTIRTFQCNLCRATILQNSGRGFSFGHNRLDWKALHEAENHICDTCVKHLLVSLKDSGIQNEIAA